VAGKLEFIKHSPMNFTEGKERVLNYNKMIQQMTLDVEMKDLTKSYQFTEHLPKLNAFANWQTQAQEDNRSFNDWRYFNSLSIGLTLKVPIFKGFMLDSKVEQAEIDYKKSMEGLAGTRKAVISQYENTVRLITKTEEQIEAYQLAKEEAQKAFDMATKRFNTGLANQLEVTDALVGLTSAELNLSQIIHKYYVHKANLDLILGKNKNELFN
jgi:outer membrane protein